MDGKKLKVVKEIKSSGMFEAKVDGSEKTVKIPPFPGVEVGKTYVLQNGRYLLVGGDKKQKAVVDPKDKKIKELEARLKKLEAIAGERGSEVKGGGTGSENGGGDK